MNPLENAATYVADLQQDLMKKAELYRTIAEILTQANHDVESALKQYTGKEEEKTSYADSYKPTKRQGRVKGQPSLTSFVHKALKKYDKTGEEFTIEELGKRSEGFAVLQGIKNELHLKTVSYGLKSYLKKYKKITTHVIENGVHKYTITEDTNA
jgi:hypothetical protein